MLYRPSNARYMNRYLVAILAVFILLTACSGQNGHDQHDVLAQVGNATLYRTDLPSHLLDDVPPSDTAHVIAQYARRWLAEELLFQRATASPLAQQHKIEEQAKRYYRQLTIDAYQRNYLAENIDTTTTQAQCEAFYGANKNYFPLQERIVRCVALVVPADNKHLSELRNLCRKQTDAALQELETLTYQVSLQVQCYPDSWVSVRALEEHLGIELAAWIPASKPLYTEVKKEDNLVLLSFYEWQEPGSPAPLSYVKSQVRTILLNQRYQAQLDSLKFNIVEQALATHSASLHGNS